MSDPQPGRASCETIVGELVLQRSLQVVVTGHDRPGIGQALQAGGDVGGLAQGQPLAGVARPHLPRHHLAGVDAHPHREADPALRKAGVETGKRWLDAAAILGAKSVRMKRYKRVDLSYKGVTKFSIDGASFQRLGEEYAKRNFDYALYTFPRLFHRSDGRQPPDASQRARVAVSNREACAAPLLTVRFRFKARG